MTIRFSVTFALFALCCTGPALAGAPSERTTSTEETANSGSEVVCRVLKVTGSRLGGKRTCMTRDQWDQQRRDQRQSVERAQQEKYYTDRAG
jgi:hypothetical protein